MILLNPAQLTEAHPDPKVNEILRAAKADGTLEQYSQKWLGRGTGVLPD